MVDDNRQIVTGNAVTIKTLNNIFNINLARGHLIVYLDVKVIFNNTITGDLNKIIFEIIKDFLKTH